MSDELDRRLGRIERLRREREERQRSTPRQPAFDERWIAEDPHARSLVNELQDIIRGLGVPSERVVRTLICHERGPQLIAEILDRYGDWMLARHDATFTPGT